MEHGLAVLISNIIIVVGIFLTAVGTFGNYYYNDKLSQEKDKSSQLEKESLINKIDYLSSTTVSLESKLKPSEPRHISLKQKEEFTEILNRSIKGKVIVHSFMNAGAEPNQYANELRNMLVESGFDCGKMVAQSLGGSVPKGIFVSVKNKNKYPKFADNIIDAFQRIGIQFELSLNDSIQENEVEIRVGLKP